MKTYSTEKEGQLDFYSKVLKRIDSNLTMEDILEDNTDGVVNGSLLEFKLNINDINAVLFQAIKYCSKRRIIGKELPKNIILVNLNQETAYIFNSQEYLEDIEKVYTLSSSLNNVGFKVHRKYTTINYKDSFDFEKLILILKEKSFTKINIDENCILGWAERYYRENPQTHKGDFLNDSNNIFNKKCEIREPDYFINYINPYTGENNIKFRYLMDKLNDKFLQKNLGAFYTPKPYVELGGGDKKSYS